MNQFISPDKNDSFVFLRGLDLQELLIQTENYFLEYRDKLNLPDNLTFGVEIEYEGVLKMVIDRFIDGLSDWESKTDCSLSSGGEITSPVLTDKISAWQELKTVCDYLTKRGADTTHNAGGHIHIGTCVLGRDVDAWRTFLKLYTAYESVLFRFIYGDKISGRANLFKYARPIAFVLHKHLKYFNSAIDVADISMYLPEDRYQSINFQNVIFSNPNMTTDKNTIEFRSPNATTEAVIWQNNINTFAKMLLSAKDKVIDEDFLDYKLENEFYPYAGNEYLYNMVSLKNVLEFVDLVFDNNLDKIYFLRQYLKDFQDSYGLKEAVRARKFVK